MKRIIIFVIAALILMFTFSACEGNEINAPNATFNTTVEQNILILGVWNNQIIKKL